MAESELYYTEQMPPILFELVQAGPVPPTWRKQLQLIYLSEGRFTLSLNGAEYHLERDQLVLIPPMSIYSISSGEGVAAVFQVDVDLVCSCCPGFRLPALRPEIPSPEENAYSRQIRELLSDVIRMSASEHRKTLPLDYLVNGVKLIALLADCCALDEDTSAAPANVVPLLNAISFTVERFRTAITVKDAAAVAGFSAPYFSKLFTRFVGIPFTDYLTELRLQEAERQLRSGFSIVQIASSCGFPDHRAFARAYRKKHGRNPSDDRRAAPEAAPQGLPPAPPSASVGQLLTTCLDNLSNETQLPIRYKHTPIADISIQSPRVPFRHTWQKSIGVGRARHLLYAVNQEMLRELQSQIHYQRGVLHSLFDDDMQVVHQNADGSYAFSFDNIDLIFDFMLSIGMEPMVQLGFMPTALAVDKTHFIYEGFSISSLPSDLEVWCRLVRDLIRHLFQRYGQSVVEGWEFCLWSKPDSAPLPFGMPDLDRYFPFYRRTYETVKACSGSLVFGSPAFLVDSISGEWLSGFFDRCRRYGCLPDRLRFDFYPMFRPADDVDIGTVIGIQHHPGADTMGSALAQIASFCRDNDLPYPQPELEEWNFSISQRELINDTSYKAVYIVKNVLECWDKSPDFAYWGFSDTLGETPLTSELFHGGLGLYAKGQLKKPAFYAFALLARLGDQLVAQGDGYVITTRGPDIQVLFYNYCHYSALYASGTEFNLSFSNRYAPFVDQRRHRFSLLLTGLANGRYLVTRHRLNRSHGSVFDNWMDMGMIVPSSRSEYDYLQGISQPLVQKAWLELQDGQYHVSSELEPFEICLFELHAAAGDKKK